MATIQSYGQVWPPTEHYLQEVCGEGISIYIQAVVITGPVAASVDNTGWERYKRGERGGRYLESFHGPQVSGIMLPATARDLKLTMPFLSLG